MASEASAISYSSDDPEANHDTRSPSRTEAVSSMITVVVDLASLVTGAR